MVNKDRIGYITMKWITSLVISQDIDHESISIQIIQLQLHQHQIQIQIIAVHQFRLMAVTVAVFKLSTQISMISNQAERILKAVS